MSSTKKDPKFNKIIKIFENLIIAEVHSLEQKMIFGDITFKIWHFEKNSEKFRWGLFLLYPK